MYEPGSALKPFGVPPGDELTTRLQPFHSTVSRLRAPGEWGGDRVGTSTGPPVTPLCHPQELEDDAIYSVHVPAGLYRVSRAWEVGPFPQIGSWPQRMPGSVRDTGHRVTGHTRSQPRCREAARQGGGEEETDSSPAWVSDPEGGVGLSCALHSLLPTAVVLPGRKPPHGNEHPQGPREGRAERERCAGEVTGVREHTPDLLPRPCALQSKLSRHGSGADSDYENTQSGDPLLG